MSPTASICSSPRSIHKTGLTQVPNCVHRRPASRIRATEDLYDYIVVGGGAAGSLLANRLSADDGSKVALLEAGSKERHWTMGIPAGIFRLFKSRFDWNLYSTVQQQLDNREVYLARGKTVGGSSTTNATLYLRGTAKDYDDWGLEGWRSDEVLEWFKYSENYMGKKSKYHGKGGEWTVEHPRYENPLHEIMIYAASKMGLPITSDFNDWSLPQEATGEFDVTQNRGTRADAYTQFLKPAMRRENLLVIGDAQASKVLFDDSKRAVGVEFRRTGAELLKRQVKLKEGGEVILCAGAIHTPHLLLLSGIGPAAQLWEHGIDLVQDLSGVGENLQDHPAVVTAHLLHPKYKDMASSSHAYDSKGNLRLETTLNYYLLKRGPMVSTSCDHGAFVTIGEHDQPNIQIRFSPGYALDPDGVSSFVKFGQLYKKGNEWPAGITFQCIAARPQSRGTVKLASDDPLDAPAVDIGFLTDAKGQDLQSLRDGIRFAREMAKNDVLNGFLAEEGYPGKDVKSDEELDAYIKRTLHSANAIVGSCKMGQSPYDGSVVSHKDLKVHGVEGLRVIDSSVIPRIPGAQTGAATIMIAEKGAHLILNGN